MAAEWFSSQRSYATRAATLSAALYGVFLGHLYFLACGLFIVNIFFLPSHVFSLLSVTNFVLLFASLLPLVHLYAKTATVGARTPVAGPEKLSKILYKGEHVVFVAAHALSAVCISYIMLDFASLGSGKKRSTYELFYLLSQNAMCGLIYALRFLSQKKHHMAMPTFQQKPFLTIVAQLPDQLSESAALCNTAGGLFLAHSAWGFLCFMLAWENTVGSILDVSFATHIHAFACVLLSVSLWQAAWTLFQFFFTRREAINIAAIDWADLEKSQDPMFVALALRVASDRPLEKQAGEAVKGCCAVIHRFVEACRPSQPNSLPLDAVAPRKKGWGELPKASPLFQPAPPGGHVGLVRTWLRLQLQLEMSTAWLQPDVTIAEAAALLAGLPPGRFLLHQGETMLARMVSVVAPTGVVLSVPVLTSDRGGGLIPRGQAFPTYDQLVRQYHTTKLPLDGTDVLLSNPHREHTATSLALAAAGLAFSAVVHRFRRATPAVGGFPAAGSAGAANASLLLQGLQASRAAEALIFLTVRSPVTRSDISVALGSLVKAHAALDAFLAQANEEQVRRTREYASTQRVLAACLGRLLLSFPREVQRALNECSPQELAIFHRARTAGDLPS